MSHEQLDLSLLPTNLKLQLLSMMNNKKPAAKPRPNEISIETKFLITKKDEKFVESIIKEIRDRGFFVADNFISGNLTSELDGAENSGSNIMKEAFSEIQTMYDEGILKRGGIGEGITKLLQEDKRGDLHCWLNAQDGEHETDRPKTPPNLRHVLQRMSKIRLTFNKLYGTRLTHDSIQVAIYPGNGARYVKHADASPLQSSERRLTVLLYFNDPSELNGGQLRIYPTERTISTPSISKSRIISHDIDPIWDRLLIFPSECFHEVLPSFSTRYAITLWMYGPDDIHANIQRELEAREGQIFVSICSYRDTECQYTIKSLFENAQFPQRLRIGICWQYDFDCDKDSLFKGYDYAKECKYANQISEIHISRATAKGPAFARHLINKYLFPLSKSKFCLQIDSHMRFENNWDVDLIRMLHQCETKSSNCVITTYPVGYELPNRLPHSPQITHLCAKSEFVSDSEDGFNYDMIRLCGKVFLSKTTQDIIPSIFWSANFSFSRSSLAKILYCDPLEYIFFGEEIIMLKRAFEAGYKMFTPNKVVAYHLWSRGHRPTFWENYNYSDSASIVQDLQDIRYVQVDPKYLKIDSKEEMTLKRNENRKKVMVELGMEGEIDEKVKAFEEYCGINFNARKISEKALFGGINDNQLLV